MNLENKTLFPEDDCSCVAELKKRDCRRFAQRIKIILIQFVLILLVAGLIFITGALLSLAHKIFLLGWQLFNGGIHIKF